MPKAALWHDDEGVPVVDAEADLMIFVTPLDIVCAVPQDPCKCAVAQAVKRSYGGQADAAILRSIAYVKAPLENGKLAWQRFRLSPVTRRRIEKFDRTGVADSAPYILKAAAPGYTLAARRRKAEKYGRKADNPNAKPVKRTKVIKLDSTVRNGTGSVPRFIKK